MTRIFKRSLCVVLCVCLSLTLVFVRPRESEAALGVAAFIGFSVLVAGALGVSIYSNSGSSERFLESAARKLDDFARSKGKTTGELLQMPGSDLNRTPKGNIIGSGLATRIAAEFIQWWVNHSQAEEQVSNDSFNYFGLNVPIFHATETVINGTTYYLCSDPVYNLFDLGISYNSSVITNDWVYQKIFPSLPDSSIRYATYSHSPHNQIYLGVPSSNGPNSYRSYTFTSNDSEWVGFGVLYTNSAYWPSFLMRHYDNGFVFCSTPTGSIYQGSSSVTSDSYSLFTSSPSDIVDNVSNFLGRIDLFPDNDVVIGMPQPVTNAVASDATMQNLIDELLRWINTSNQTGKLPSSVIQPDTAPSAADDLIDDLSSSDYDGFPNALFDAFQNFSGDIWHYVKAWLNSLSEGAAWLSSAWSKLPDELIGVIYGVAAFGAMMFFFKAFR